MTTHPFYVVRLNEKNIYYNFSQCLKQHTFFVFCIMNNSRIKIPNYFQRTNQGMSSTSSLTSSLVELVIKKTKKLDLTLM